MLHFNMKGGCDTNFSLRERRKLSLERTRARRDSRIPDGGDGRKASLDRKNCLRANDCVGQSSRM
jgi:hypothetical protein